MYIHIGLNQNCPWTAFQTCTVKSKFEVIFSIVTTHELNIVCNSCVYCVRMAWSQAIPMMQMQQRTRTWRVLTGRRISVWRAWGRRTHGWIRSMLKSSTSSTEGWIRWMKRASSSLQNINVGLRNVQEQLGLKAVVSCPCVCSVFDNVCLSKQFLQKGPFHNDDNHHREISFFSTYIQLNTAHVASVPLRGACTQRTQQHLQMLLNQPLQVQLQWK